VTAVFLHADPRRSTWSIRRPHQVDINSVTTHETASDDFIRESLTPYLDTAHGLSTLGVAVFSSDSCAARVLVGGTMCILGPSNGASESSNQSLRRATLRASRPRANWKPAVGSKPSTTTQLNTGVVGVLLLHEFDITSACTASRNPLSYCQPSTKRDRLYLSMEASKAKVYVYIHTRTRHACHDRLPAPADSAWTFDSNSDTPSSFTSGPTTTLICPCMLWVSNRRHIGCRVRVIDTPILLLDHE